MTQIGAVLAGKYRVLAKLGEGGMGSVFRAENLLTGKQVALKCLHPQVMAQAESSERLLREARRSSNPAPDKGSRDAGTKDAGAPAATRSSEADEADAGTCDASACSAEACEVAIAARRDDYSVMSSEVPASWGTVWGNGWHNHPFPSLPTPLGPGLNVSSNLGSWAEGTTTPGLFIAASVHLTKMFEPATVLQRYAYYGCVSEATSPWTSAGFTGSQVSWHCTQGHGWFVVAMWPDDHSYIAVMEAKLTAACDRQYAQHALQSLSIEPTSKWPAELR